MTTKLANLLVTATFGLFVAMFGPAAQADECKVLGSLSKFELAADGKSAQAVVRNTKTGEDTMLTITDELTINRFKNKPMEPGNEIRAHFEKDGKNTCNLFEHAVGGHDRGVGSEYFNAKNKS